MMPVTVVEEALNVTSIVVAVGTSAFHNADFVRFTRRVYRMVFQRHWEPCWETVWTWWK